MTTLVVPGSHPSWGDVRLGPTAPHAVAGEDLVPAQTEVAGAATIGSRPEELDMDLDDDIANLIRDQANMEYYKRAEQEDEMEWVMGTGADLVGLATS